MLGHLERLERLEGRLRRLGGLFVACNAYRGIAVGKLMNDAEHVAEAMWAEVLAPPGDLPEPATTGRP